MSDDYKMENEKPEPAKEENQAVEATNNNQNGKKMLEGSGKSAILAAVLSFFCFACLGQFYLGQNKKAIILLI